MKGLAKFLTNPVVHENINTYVAPLLTTLYSWYNGPSEENSTIQAIQARLRLRKSESVEQEKRRVAKEQKDMEEQKRMEDERERNDLALSQQIDQKNSELILLRCNIEQLRIESLQRQQEEDMRSEQERQEAEEAEMIGMQTILVESARQAVIAHHRQAAEEAEGRRWTALAEAARQAGIAQHRQATAQAEQSRIEMQIMLAEATIQTTNAQNEERRIDLARDEAFHRAEARRIVGMRRTQVARQVEDRRKAKDEERRARTARQVEQRRRTEDERLLVIAATEAAEKSRIESEKRRAEATRQEEETKRADEERRSIEQMRTENGNNVRTLMEAEETVAQKAFEVKQLEHKRLEARRQNSQRVRLALWPHIEQYETAKKELQYDPASFMFAVAGMAGVGKSSLINIFLNLSSKDAGAARMGTTETTLKIARYPDPGQEPPRKWIVWYDIPGAGTVKIPAWMYFNNQCLFLFDVILVLVGDRVFEADLEILKQCRTFGIPSMIVRSKSDMHIRNMATTRAEEDRVEMDDALLSECREQYIADTRENIAAQLLEASLPPHHVYLVSSQPAIPFRNAYSSFAGGPAFGGYPTFIDEMQLIQDLVIAASQRRGGSTPGHRDGTEQDVGGQSTPVLPTELT